MYLDPKKAAIVTLTCCYLHNFLIEENGANYLPGNVETLDTSTCKEQNVKIIPPQPNLLKTVLQTTTIVNKGCMKIPKKYNFSIVLSATFNVLFL